jgi:hypothetical protein
MNCRGDDAIDAKRSRPSIGKTRECARRAKRRVVLVGTRSADHIRASGHSGRIQRPNTWLHPNVSLKCPIFPLHRGRRPYMAHRRHCRMSLIGANRQRPALPVNGDRRAGAGRARGVQRSPTGAYRKSPEKNSRAFPLLIYYCR